MPRFFVSLTNPDDMADCGPFSHGSGRYGFTVRANDMAGAVNAVERRARADGIWGHDWSAHITRRDEHGHSVHREWYDYPARMPTSYDEAERHMDLR